MRTGLPLFKNDDNALFVTSLSVFNSWEREGAELVKMNERKNECNERKLPQQRLLRRFWTNQLSRQ